MEKQSFWLIPGMAVITLFSCTARGRQEDNKSRPAAITMTTTSETAIKEPVETGVEVGGIIIVASKSIVHNLSQVKSLSTLALLMKSAGCDTLLQKSGEYTLLAPGNEAFNELSEPVMDSLMAPGARARLRQLLSRHIIPGSYGPSALREGMTLRTMSGEWLSVKLRNGDWYIGNAAVLTRGAPCSNGTLWVIGKVLLPE